MDCWNNTQKWVVRNCDDAKADLSKLQHYLIQDSQANYEGSASPLHLATAGKNISIIYMILSFSKQDLKIRDEQGAYPLHWACFRGNLQAIEIFLDKYDANKHVTDYDGNTILHYAVEGGHLEIVKQLIEKYNLDFERKNTEKKSALDFACDEELDKIVKYLIQRGASLQETLDKCVKVNNPTMVRILVKYGLSQKQLQWVDKNPLHYALMLDRVRVTKVLLRYTPWLAEYCDKNGNKPTDYITSDTNKKIIALIKKNC